MVRRSLSLRWSWLRPVVAAAILGMLVWRLGAETFLDPLQRLDGPSVAAAAVLAAASTCCAAWRWRMVSAGLGSDLPLPGAVAAYYRSQFLNLVLPGGVLGDVHRALRRGRDLGDVPHAARAVVAERCAGQLVQVAVTVVALLVLPSPVRPLLGPIVLGLLAMAGVVVAARVVAGPRPSGSRGRLATRVRQVVGPWPGRAWWLRSGPRVVATSVVAVGAHAATFVIAARVAGASTSLGRLVALALLILLAMAVPVHVAGWGPREGVAAWAFAAAGLGATVGVGAAVVYGVLALLGALPGGILLATSALAARREATRQASSTGHRRHGRHGPVAGPARGSTPRSPALHARSGAAHG